MENIKTRLTNILKFLPVYFKEYDRPILVTGLIFAMLAGLWIFYKDAYSVTNDSYDVFVTERKANEELINDVVTYIKKQGVTLGGIPVENPFVK